MRSFATTLVSLIAVITFTNSAQAAVAPAQIKATLEAQPACQNFVRYDDQYLYLGFGPYMRGAEKPRLPIPGRLEVSSFDDSSFHKTLLTLDGAIDAVSVGDRLYVLTYSQLEEWSQSSWQRVALHQTYMTGTTWAYREHATGMQRIGDILVISHGRLGVSLFDLRTNRLMDQQRLLRSQLPLESQIMGVARVGSLAVLIVDSFSLVPSGKPPFTGLIVFDPVKREVVREIAGLGPGYSTIQILGDRMLLGTFSYIGRHTIAELRGTTISEERNPVAKFDEEGGQPFNRYSMDEQYIYTCFSKPPPVRGQRYLQIPRALDRAALGL